MTKSMELVEAVFTVVDRPFKLDVEGAGKITPDWQDWVVRTLRYFTYEVVLDDGLVQVRRDNDHVGTLAFHTVEEILQEYPDDESFRVRSPVPWVGDVLGYVSYADGDRDATLDSDDRHFLFARSLGTICVGPVIDVINDEVHQPLEEVRFPLSDAMARSGGFRDALISDDQAYLDLMNAELNERARAIGITTPIYVAKRDHIRCLKNTTPFYFAGISDPKGPAILDRDGKRIQRPERILDRELVGFWHYDYTWEADLKSLGIFSVTRR